MKLVGGDGLVGGGFFGLDELFDAGAFFGDL